MSGTRGARSARVFFFFFFFFFFKSLKSEVEGEPHQVSPRALHCLGLTFFLLLPCLCSHIYFMRFPPEGSALTKCVGWSRRAPAGCPDARVHLEGTPYLGDHVGKGLLEKTVSPSYLTGHSGRPDGGPLPVPMVFNASFLFSLFVTRICLCVYEELFLSC